MTAAAISAQLVDIRNVGTHKVVKLTLHAPEEHAMAIMEAFGWPTMVAPVPVALARLEAKKPPRQESVPASAGADKERRPFETLPYATQAGIRCNDPVFWAFLREMCAKDAGDVRDAEGAKQAVYKLCEISSRTLITPGTEAEEYWLALNRWFETWLLKERVA